jgi:hypothetical protein
MGALIDPAAHRAASGPVLRNASNDDLEINRLGLFLLVVLAACGVDYTRLTSTRFADWNGRPPDPELLKTGDVILRLMDSPQGAVLAVCPGDTFPMSESCFSGTADPGWRTAWA